MSDPQEAIVQEFLVESFDNLANINEDLTRYEKNVEDEELLNSIYRKIHTLKGSASFLGLKKLQEITHTVESTLDYIRDKTFHVNSDLIDIFLESFDTCIQLLKNIEETGIEGEFDTSDILRRLRVRLEQELLRSRNELSAEQAPQGLNIGVEEESSKDLEKKGGGEFRDKLDELLEDHDKEKEVSKKPISEEGKVNEKKVSSPKKKENSPGAGKGKNVKEVKKAEKTSTPGAGSSPGGRSNISESIVRVNVHLLDKIMNVVGELVIARNQILQYSKVKDDADLNRYAQQLNVITTDLQTDIMTTRMQPVGSVFNKFERIVRDLSRAQKKKVKLEIIGQNTELDKTLLEVIKDPMTHLIRNSLDHGLELPEVREEIGKDSEGLLSIKAYHEGGQVVIEISDDGNGINTARVKAKAVEKGIMSREEVDALALAKVHGLIFHPGFSTAEQVTNISGRGVGMDVVKSNIEKIGGEVEVTSEEGVGTTFRLKIPLTLAIVPALVVEGGGETFAIHQKNLVELVLLDQKEFGKIENLHSKEFFRLRGELIPVIRLNKVLSLPDRKHEQGGVLNIIVLKAEGKTYGLIVDEILDTQEIVVKPLDKMLKNVKYYSGSTIMGDGRVALIIDAFGFYNQFDPKDATSKESSHKKVEPPSDKYYESIEVILFKLGDGRSYAVALSLIDRLEEFEFSKVEWSGDQALIRYRNSSMPLINVEKVLDLKGESIIDSKDQDRLNCIVTKVNGVFFGIVVKEIIDIAMSESELESDTVDRAGLLGTIYIDEKLITLLDLFEIVNKTEVGRKLFSVDMEKGELKGRVLVVEDGALYRRVYQDMLTDLGLDVSMARNGVEGFDLYKENGNYDLVITDIEMPLKNGDELARDIRKKDKDIPILAISSKIKEKVGALGEENLFSDSLEKLNKKEFVAVLSKYLA